MDVFLTSDGFLALMTLAALEIVLGVDNLVSLRSSAASCRHLPMRILAAPVIPLRASRETRRPGVIERSSHGQRSSRPR
jgi:hypothetical protein